MKTDKALITTMIQDGKSKKNKESPNLHCDEILDFKDSELTLLDDNFY